MKKIPTAAEVMAGESFASWRQAQAHLRHLQSACAAALAVCGIAADTCAVEQLTDGTLHLVTTSPASAARLRQSLPTFMRALERTGIAVHTCHIVAVRTPTQTPK